MQSTLKEAEIVGLNDRKIESLLRKGKLNSGQIKRISDAATALERRNKDVEDTKLDRVHGGLTVSSENIQEMEVEEMIPVVWSDKRYTHDLYKDKFLGIDILKV